MVSEADGYQPHLVAPEQGYRRLIDSTLVYFRGPAEASVDTVSAFCFLFFSKIPQLMGDWTDSLCSRHLALGRELQAVNTFQAPHAGINKRNK